MWKEILKIDMDEARRLGEKYVPRDMAEGRAKAQRERYFEKIKDHTRRYEKMKKKVMALEGESLWYGSPAGSKQNAERYQEILDGLEAAKEKIGEASFDSLLSRLYNYSRKLYPTREEIEAEIAD